MPIQINKGVIGKEFPPFVVTSSAGKIKEFARAIGDDNPALPGRPRGRRPPSGATSSRRPRS